MKTLLTSFQVLAINKRVQTQNNAPPGFPNFVREGYEIVILADGYQESQDGLIWKVCFLTKVFQIAE